MIEFVMEGKGAPWSIRLKGTTLPTVGDTLTFASYRGIVTKVHRSYGPNGVELALPIVYCEEVKS